MIGTTTQADSVRRQTISSPFIHRKQQEHFLLMDVIPHVFTLVALVWLAFRPIGWPEMLSLLGMWIVTGLGISAGYHRLFTHGSYRTTSWMETMIAICGSMAGQGAVVSWVAIHRRHHQCSDDIGDPHSPNLYGTGLGARIKGIAHSHVLWMRHHDYPNPIRYAPDVLRNPRIIAVDKRYYTWVALGILLPAIFCATIEHSFVGFLSGALWGGFVRLAFVGNIVWAINSFLHSFGRRTYKTKDCSRNASFLGLLSFGEAFHNNHHAFPRSASFGLRQSYLDPAYWLIAGLAKAGIASNVWVPSEAQIIARGDKYEEQSA